MSDQLKPFTPSFSNAFTQYSRAVQMIYADVNTLNTQSTSSFQYDPQSYPLKNSQQVNADWSQFVNHCFFMSAPAKVNAAFSKIVNTFPFDQPRHVAEAFFENLNGFEKWLYDQFPKYRGELHFQDSWISVTDSVASSFPNMTSNATTGVPVLAPKSCSMTIDFQISIDSASSSTPTVVCQKTLTPLNGFTVYVITDPTSGAVNLYAAFNNAGNSASYSVGPVRLNTGFNHVCVVIDRDSPRNSLKIFVEGSLLAQSVDGGEFADFSPSIDEAQFNIGSGSTFYDSTRGTLTPSSTLSGTLDEFRVFHSARTVAQMKSYSSRAVYPTSDLVLYYKFNEPRAPLTPNGVLDNIVLDSSGNSLHSQVVNFNSSMRRDASTDVLNPLTNERLDTSPVLFPAYPQTVSMLTDLLYSGSLYDSENPNLITKLVPPHYLSQGSRQDGTVDGAGTVTTVTSAPTQTQQSSIQQLLMLLYTIASYYDELKLFVDSFSSLNWVSYDKTDNVPDNFLPQLIDTYGVYMPPLFNETTLQQFVDGEDYEETYSLGVALKNVQNELTRRVLINMPAIMRSKGTQRSIKTFLHSHGIDTRGTVRLREYGGPTEKLLDDSREIRTDTLYSVTVPPGAYGVSDGLYAPRVEPGDPVVSGSPSDNLLTSGSWALECNVRTELSRGQSLVRLYGMSGSQSYSFVNMIADGNGVSAYVSTGTGVNSSSNSPLLQLSVRDIDSHLLTQMNTWNVSLSCERTETVESLYTLRVGCQSNGSLLYASSTSSLFKENAYGGMDALRTVNAYNPGGARVIVGDLSPTSGSMFLGSLTGLVNSFSVGSLANVRFWSRALSESESLAHSRDCKSSGTDDPHVNYGFVHSMTGSYGRLRMSVMDKQSDVVPSVSGEITFHDTSLNNIHMHGHSFFTNGSSAYVHQTVNQSVLSTIIDETSTDDKVRVRGFQDPSNLNAGTMVAPVYDISYVRPSDDTRFSVDVSMVDALNRDIVSIMSSLNTISTAVGKTNLLFSSDYPDLEFLSDVYFQRLSGKLDFKSFFDFYKWFDDSISTFIQQLVPKKTNYRGLNFLVESHMLERAKVQYFGEDAYVGEADKTSIKSVLLLELITGNVSRF